MPDMDSFVHPSHVAVQAETDEHSFEEFFQHEKFDLFGLPLYRHAEPPRG
jgi:hypothetical protein